MGVLLDAIPLEDWREVVSAAVAAAKPGDATAPALGGQTELGRAGPADGRSPTVIRPRSARRQAGETAHDDEACIGTAISSPMPARERMRATGQQDAPIGSA